MKVRLKEPHEAAVAVFFSRVARSVTTYLSKLQMTPALRNFDPQFGNNLSGLKVCTPNVEYTEVSVNRFAAQSGE